jgi:hypothetical protein
MAGSISTRAVLLASLLGIALAMPRRRRHAAH